jgi:hypothetical protein
VDVADEGKASDTGGAEAKRSFLEREKRSFVETRSRKAKSKTELARRLTTDQITVVGIELDVPGQGRISLRPGGGGGATSWDADLSDAKADSDPTDQFFDMDGADGINDMDPCDPLRRGGGGTIFA